MDTDRFGRGTRTLRIRRNWRQADLAARAGVSRWVVGRLERGRSAGLAVDDIDAIARALDATTRLTLLWHGEALDRLLDEAHARLVGEVVMQLRGMGWEVAVEVTFSRFGERGSIDVLAFHPGARLLLVIEVKSVVPDVQAMLSGLDRKARLGPEIARERGWAATATARLLVLWDTSTNRRRLARHEAAVRAALPAGTREVRAWLRSPVEPAIAGVWFVPSAGGMSTMGVSRRRVRVKSDGSRRGAGGDVAEVAAGGDAAEVAAGCDATEAPGPRRRG